MHHRSDLSTLAGKLRAKLFEEAGDDIELVISSNPANKKYLSGYHSMTHDVAPHYQSAVIATRETAALVVHAADAGPALEVLGDPALVYRYGTFYFETAEGATPEGYNVPGAENFADAVAKALDDYMPKEGQIGVDCSNGTFLRSFLSGAGLDGQLTDATDIFQRSRATKLEGEIERIREATKLVEKGFNAVLKNVRVGMTERDVAALITHEMALGGGIPRFVSATSGERAALADAYPTTSELKQGDLLRLDAGCSVDGYNSDMARTIVFGEPDPLQEKRYHAIGTGLEDELAAVRNGKAASEVFNVAVQSVQQNGIPEYKRHHCGHGIGLNSTEFPSIARSTAADLQAGMCLCVETPFYELGWSGMMVEDTILVTEDGYEPITTIPRQLFVI